MSLDSLGSYEILSLPTSELMEVMRRGCRSAEPATSAQARVTVNRLRVRPRHELPPLTAASRPAPSSSTPTRRTLSQRAALAAVAPKNTRTAAKPPPAAAESSKAAALAGTLGGGRAAADGAG